MLEKGNVLPDYTGINPQGDTVKLASITENGNITLVNFWATWCSECLRHNPELISLYEEYSNRQFAGHGFKIISISLDFSTSDWKNGIENQKLKWENHLSDLEGFDSEQIKKFRINFIPSNYLLDHEGKIIGINVESAGFERIIRERYKDQPL